MAETIRPQKLSFSSFLELVGIIEDAVEIFGIHIEKRQKGPWWLL